MAKIHYCLGKAQAVENSMFCCILAKVLTAGKQKGNHYQCRSCHSHASRLDA